MDFLAFSDDPPSTMEFCPSTSSSPQKSWQYTPTAKHNSSWGWNRGRDSDSYRNNSFNNSRSYNRSFNKSSDNYQQPRFNNSNRSFNSTYNSWAKTDSSFESPKNKISKYLHPSFMEDPWAKLELQQKSESDEQHTGDSINIDCSEPQ